jgi:hypothetical protein
MHPSSPLRLGNLYENSAKSIIEAADTNVALQFIRAVGPLGLLQELSARYAPVDMPAAPRHICELCLACCSTEAVCRQLKELTEEENIRHKVNIARLVRLGEVERSYA